MERNYNAEGITSDSQPSHLVEKAEKRVLKQLSVSCLCDFQAIPKKQEGNESGDGDIKPLSEKAG